ncbi:flagellar biosynthesis protein FlhF [Paraburkholderia gardini]|uniref:flagellar biosynthesis protein FlhF n=1 Tax=Paraburkholderia gardini TaxID=2823469 RepID=UPI001E65A22A|nr:flagellar biosynthesis protein FlhF [Paraburkholderia gardini]
MNIRKFVGATSRDALRLVREALGSDAVVLSNRTIEDGTVEIVALADRDLAAISPAQQAADDFGSGVSFGAGNSGNGNFGTGLNGGAGYSGANPGSGTGSNTTMSTGFGGAPASYPSSAMPSMAVNPYASAMPDVFSSVFGASPEAGTERAATPAGETGSNDSSTLAGNAGGTTSSTRTTDDARIEIRSEARLESRPDTRAGSRASGRPENRIDARPDMPTPPSVMTPLPAIAEAPGRPRTMVETNPWLIDHARRIAATDVAHTAKSVMTPATAMARGLGAPVDTLAAIDDPGTPDWAREAADLAARRAAPRAAPAKAAAKGGVNSLAGLSPGAAAAVTDGIKARMEQIVNETVMSELASLRGMMEEQFTGLLWADRQRRSPTHAALTRHLFAAGFSAQLVKMMVENLPAVENMDAGMEWVHSVLGANLPVIENEDALMERGGVFALTGPTGVGKTTTTAKLAARCVMRFGASKVALLTTDSYRIGGHEQLRIFGKILGVSVHAVKDGADLQLALSELRNKHIVLIDTIGMSQRDRSVSDQIAMLCGTGQPVQRLLLLNATSHGDTLNEVVQAYQKSPDNQALAGCILTKLDEATNLGSVLDTVIRYKLPVHYVSTGQKVPENLYVATKKFLIKSAFCIPRDGSPFVPQDDDIPALLSALSARSTADLHEVRFG